MLAAAERCVYFPMHGFIESFNLSVAAALVTQRLLDACPHARGDLAAEGMGRLRSKWYTDLARTDEESAAYLQLAQAGGAVPFRDPRRAPEHRAQQHYNAHVIKRQSEAEAQREQQAKAAASVQ